mmetsp:Transcript_155384/g.498553  ORF Transcript_155384/g.498553 Transcript_155384/m.498553 type:complete len:566 (+) Transcript_155384:459-2156(+)
MLRQLVAHRAIIQVLGCQVVAHNFCQRALCARLALRHNGRKRLRASVGGEVEGVVGGPQHTLLARGRDVPLRAHGVATKTAVGGNRFVDMLLLLRLPRRGCRGAPELLVVAAPRLLSHAPALRGSAAPVPSRVLRLPGRQVGAIPRLSMRPGLGLGLGLDLGRGLGLRLGSGLGTTGLVFGAAIRLLRVGPARPPTLDAGRAIELMLLLIGLLQERIQTLTADGPMAAAPLPLVQAPIREVAGLGPGGGSGNGGAVAREAAARRRGGNAGRALAQGGSELLEGERAVAIGVGVHQEVHGLGRQRLLLRHNLLAGDLAIPVAVQSVPLGIDGRRYLGLLRPRGADVAPGPVAHDGHRRAVLHGLLGAVRGVGSMVRRLAGLQEVRQELRLGEPQTVLAVQLEHAVAHGRDEDQHTEARAEMLGARAATRARRLRVEGSVAGSDEVVRLQLRISSLALADKLPGLRGHRALRLEEGVADGAAGIGDGRWQRASSGPWAALGSSHPVEARAVLPHAAAQRRAHWTRMGGRGGEASRVQAFASDPNVQAMCCRGRRGRSGATREPTGSA